MSHPEMVEVAQVRQKTFSYHQHFVAPGKNGIELYDSSVLKTGFLQYLASEAMLSIRHLPHLQVTKSYRMMVVHLVRFLTMTLLYYFQPAPCSTVQSSNSHQRLYATICQLLGPKALLMQHTPWVQSPHPWRLPSASATDFGSIQASCSAAPAPW